MLLPLGTLHVDQERTNGKIAMIVLADQTKMQPHLWAARQAKIAGDTGMER